MPSLSVFFILLSLMLAGAFALWSRAHARRRSLSPQPYAGHIPSPGAYTHTAFEELAPLGASLLPGDPPPAWRDQMFSLGERIAGAGVRSVFFVHGTFVGDDPFDLRRLPGPALAATGALGGLVDLLARAPKTWAGESGNFTDAYVRLFAAALGHDIAATAFPWSSANHHAARLCGALGLLAALARARREGPLSGRVLLIGHSHAGQLFSILSQLLVSERRARDLVCLTRPCERFPDAVRRDLAALRGLRLDIVTLGTPPRYGWGASRRVRLLHIINHRGKAARAGLPDGLPFTRDGDYIQQYGIAGSDTISPVPEDRETNTRLDAVLGVGSDLDRWWENVRHRVRLHNRGFHYLVDYGDSASYPNALATLAGHGVYTSATAMLFNARLIVDHFYPAKGRRCQSG